MGDAPSSWTMVSLGAELYPRMGMFIYVPRAHHDTARMSQAGTLIVYKQFKKLQELATDSFVNPFYTKRQARVCAALMNVPQRSTLLQQKEFLASVVP